MLYLGTSGWSYKDWGQTFYPPKLPASQQLPFLAQHFSTVELNASFYRLPAISTFERWRDITPPNFRFSVKVSRIITHHKRLANVANDWEEFITHASVLRDKLSIYLLQFPPSFAVTAEATDRLKAFLDYATQPPTRLAFEFRHPTWFQPDGLAFISHHRLCLVQAESSRFPHSPASFSPAAFAYYRFHGPRKLYSSQYTDEELQHWAAQIQAELAAAKDAYVYFDNDFHGYALDDARRLLRELQTQEFPH